ncbi:MAG: hypothetical protein OYL41_04470 [Acidobacteriota bacterium]|nr:hypothetical protein [Acidobacteriota bacterium]
MDAEIGTVAALAVLLIGLFAWLRQDIRKLDSKLDTKTDSLRDDLSAFRERMAHLVGLLVGLREAIARRTA